MSNHNKIMTDLKSSLHKLITPLKHKKVIYLDYPIHHNIGDLLIYLGAMELLKENGFDILAQFTALNATPEKIEKILKQHNQEVSLIFHGGGNFGDIYAPHQNCRLAFIDKFPHINTLIFPQTIYYNNKVKMAEDIKIFRKHKDLTISVRDIKSEALAYEFCDNITLFPDTAHMLWQTNYQFPQNKLQEPKKLTLNRWDDEGDNAEQKRNFDWAMIITTPDLYLKTLLNKINAKNKFLIVDKLVTFIWQKHCENICLRAAKYFSDFTIIETNRLHGHILSCLLSKKNLVLDNNYGKNSTYIDQWTLDSDLVSMATKAGTINED